jgi:tetratricopeptide (TPR) repeat protein
MPTSGASQCPPLSAVETFVADESPAQDLAAHLTQCARCREQVDTVRANLALLARIEESRADLADAASGGTTAAPSIPGYEITGEIHRGGQGVVYEAVQLATRRTVALKVLLAGAFATSKQRIRFEREIDLVVGLAHPNVVTVYDSGVTGDGRLWFAMEHLEGMTLGEHVKAGDGTPLEETLRLFAKICGAVSHAHQRGVIHRDLKPGNVIVDGEGEPHVLDFGLAKPLNPDIDQEQATVTEPGGFMGTLAYASPEQTHGDPAQVDVRSDVYALGVILYEMLTGRFPYPITGPMSDIIKTILTVPPRPLREAPVVSYRLDNELETIARTALAKEPERRYESAEALRRDIGHYLAGEPIDAKRDSGWYVITKTLRRYKVQVAAAVALVLLLVGFGIAMSVAYRQARNEADKVSKINVFLEDTLGSVERPGQAEVTVRNFLDEGVYWVDVALADKPEVEAAVRTVIGNAYRNIERYEDAEKQLMAGLWTRRALFGERNLEVAKSYSSLGLLRLAQGRLDEAEAHLVRTLEIRRDLLGDDDLDVALALGNIATLRRARGDLNEAERLFRDALAIRRTRLGEEHSDVAMSQFSLALVFEDRGADAQALPLHEQALATRRAVVHRDHPDVARSLVALGTLHMRLGQTNAAEPLLRECVERHERVLPEGHWRTARARRLLGECLAALARYDEAQSYLRAGYDGLADALGEQHAETVAAREALDSLYEAEK